MRRQREYRDLYEEAKRDYEREKVTIQVGSRGDSGSIAEVAGRAYDVHPP
jgi:hypothetical protein